jgi:CRP-like cAMP-binding protein
VVELEEVVSISRLVHKPRGAMIYMEGDPAESFYVVHHGRVKISMLSPNGRELIMEIIGPGEVFGELALVDDSPHVTMAETLDDVLLDVFWKESFRNIISRPEVASSVARFVGLRLRKIERKVCDLVHKDVSARIIDMLIEMAGTGWADPHNILVRPNHQDIAGLIGASRQAATIALNDLERLGWVELHRGSICTKSLHDLQSRQH